VSEDSRVLRLLHNIVWGNALTAIGATLLSAYVIVLAALRGSWQFDTYGVSGTTIILSYYGAGILAGTSIGILRPLLRWWIGAAFVGAVAGMFGYGAVAYADSGTLDFAFALLVGSPIGAVVGVGLWHHDRKYPIS
jgi:hypothetical protein